MKQVLFTLLLGLIISLEAFAQEETEVVISPPVPEQATGTVRVYAELSIADGILSSDKNVKVYIDLGQHYSSFKSYTIQDENNRDIKFNSMVAAMNYMGERGWKLIQVYTYPTGNSAELRWLMYRDLGPGENIMDGLNVKNLN